MYGVPECAYTSPVSIESGMLVTCGMQCAMSVSLRLLLTACVSHSVHISLRGTWAVITLCESFGYVGIGYVKSFLLSLLCHSSYVLGGGGAEDMKQHTSLLISVCAMLASTTSPLHYWLPVSCECSVCLFAFRIQ